MSTSYQIAGKQVHCAHCGQTEFESRKVLLNTRGATFFNFDWLNKGATALTCQHCSRIEWFAQEPQAGGGVRADALR
ncbi:hypothetical protein Verru16b_00249 [Lacunisphaera limnophila]|uniref:DNA-binding protein n=1 Tax=Lacunisphaera limnophila TaxID=1838286 RepID=A0A1I7PHV9_9BACT|nr:zinc ribbon domain-containing protein [Lacunisphaera limnophila]AOS43206.1 hypothetical protein Verru16b_00249 [Lacunisphaera limnophila]